MGRGQAEGLTAYRMFTARTYRLDEPARVGGTVRSLEAMFTAAGSWRVFVQKVHRGEQIIEAGPDVRLEAGDVIALSGRHEALVAASNRAGSQEVDDPDLLKTPVQVLDVADQQGGPRGRPSRRLRRPRPSATWGAGCSCARSSAPTRRCRSSPASSSTEATG